MYKAQEDTAIKRTNEMKEIPLSLYFLSKHNEGDSKQNTINTNSSEYSGETSRVM